MPRLLRLSSLRIGLYVAVMAGLVMMDRTSLSAFVLMALGLLVFLLALLGSQLKAHKALTYGLVFLSVGIITLAFGDLQSSLECFHHL